MAISGLTLGLTLSSLGLSAYSSKVQLKNMKAQAKTQGMLATLNTSKYKADLLEQQGNLISDSKVALSEIERNDANRNVGVNTASQSLVQNVLGEIEASGKNIEKNVRDMEFGNKIGQMNAEMGIKNAKSQALLGFLGQGLKGGANLYGEHRSDVQAKEQAEGLQGAINKNRSAINSILDNM